MPAPSELHIASSSGAYPVHIGLGGFSSLAERSRDVVIIDERLLPFVDVGGMRVVAMEATEAAKTMAGAEQVVLALRDAGVRRGDHVVAVGGGVIQDLATFATAIYMRGIAWTYVPTTLMAMADSCVGGKSSINAGGVKNLVGGIYPPVAVIVDPAFLRTLPPEAIAAGLAEAVKINFCRGAADFEDYLRLHASFDADPVPLLVQTLSAKKWFVEIDEHDRKERRLLNFGHTWGHALESAVEHRVSHGVAVAIGMLCALRHPLSQSTAAAAALEAHCRALLQAVPDLPEALDTFDASVFERAFRSDKKHGSDSFRIMVADHEGVCEVEVSADGGAWTAISEATAGVLASLSGSAS